MYLLAEIAKQPARFDAIKHPSVLGLERLNFTWFHLVSLILFACAVCHTLCAPKLHAWLDKREAMLGKRTVPLHFLYFLSQVEVIFAFWVIPLFLAICFFYDWSVALEYLNTRDYTEPMFVVVILSLTATRPIVRLAEKMITRCAKAFGGSLSAWWLVLLTLGPLMGSLITEAGAMMICALLLSRTFYRHRPSTQLAYATLALLFVNISVGGVLTDFASPAVLVLAHTWNWTSLDMLTDFGWKAALGILASNFLYWFYFRKELAALNVQHKEAKEDKDDVPIPFWITLIHILFIVWIVAVSYYTAVFVASFLFFIAFHQATHGHQYPIRLAHPLLVGLFLAGLVIHGGLQGWWVVGMLDGLDPLPVMGVAMSMTAFNDNTAISYLATLIPNWGEIYEYAIFTGVIAGGGLTVIANAPNPAGYSILKHHFASGIRPLKLFLAALIPTLILYAIFYFLGPLFWGIWL